MGNRRDFLRNASLLTAGGLLIGKTGCAPAVITAQKELGLQIYSLQKELYDDIPKRMRELKDMGYVKLELAGYGDGKISGVDMMEFKKMAEDAGLKIVSSHVNPTVPGVPFLLDYTKELAPRISEYWKVAAADHVKLGCKYLVQPMMPNVNTHEDASLICDIFNDAGRICKDAGIVFGYHNHNFEFKRIVTPEEAAKPAMPWETKGDQILDLFLDGTDPSLVNFELDVYWTVRGGNDPLDYLQKHPERIVALHIKDTVVLGQSGLLNFENIFNRMYAVGIQDYFVELEQMPDGRPQMAGVKDCAAYLQNAPFVK